MNKENNQKTGKFRVARKCFSMVSNTALQDADLSLGAKGLYAMIESYINIPNFTLYKNHLMEISGVSHNTFDKYWNELKDLGYLTVFKIQTQDGFIYEYQLNEERTASDDNGNGSKTKPKKELKPRPKTSKKTVSPTTQNMGAGENSPTTQYLGSGATTQNMGSINNNKYINNNNTVVVNNNRYTSVDKTTYDNRKNKLDEDTILKKLKLNKQRYLEVGLLTDCLISKYDKEFLSLLKMCSPKEQEYLNNTTESELFNLYYKLIQEKGDAIDDAKTEGILNPEGYLRGIIKNKANA